MTNARGAKTKRTVRGTRRGAQLQREQSGVLKEMWAKSSQIPALIPWRRCLLHLSIFCFWLVVLSAGIFGARWIDQPITRIDVVGNFKHIHQDTIRDELNDVLQQSFFTLNLASIRQRLEARPWVKRARVERHWPNLLRVSIEEEQAAALWNQQGFINPEGKVVITQQHPAVSGLPVLYGATDQAEILLTNYQKWRLRLAAVGLEIQSLRLQRRGAWQVGFTGGWLLKLGKSDVEGRLERFITLYGKRLYRDEGNILAIDARYTQGVSVAWRVDQDAILIPEQS